MLGLNPLEQEIVDLTNEIARDGAIYFPQFCQVVHKKYREEDEDLFRMNMFKVKSDHYSKLITRVWSEYVPFILNKFFQYKVRI